MFLFIRVSFDKKMEIDSIVIPSSSKKGRKAGRYFSKWIFYSATGIGVMVIFGFIKELLPVIGIAFLLAFIWSQSTNTRRY